jgi:hypothetical protein
MLEIAKNCFLLFIVLALFLACKIAVLFLVPGILLLYFLKNDQTPALILKIIGCSLSFWMAAFWLLKYIPISLADLFNGCSIITLTALLYLGVLKRKAYYPKIDRESIFFVILFIYTAILRFLPLLATITPPGADMSMHTYMTALISINNGIPSSYFPIFNISEFNSFPVGFHTISALTSYAADLPYYQSAFVTTCITYLLATFSLYLLIRHYVCFEIAAVTAFFFTFLTIAPQRFVCWGGNPTILSFVFAVLFLTEILQLKYDQKYIITAAFFLSGIFLTHTIIFIQSFYIIGISFILYLLLQKNKSLIVGRLLGVLLLFVLIVSSYLVQIDFDVITIDVINWIKNWVRNTSHAWHGTILNSWWSVPHYILNQIVNNDGRSVLVVVLGIIGVYSQLKKTNRILIIQLLSSLLMVVILIINTQYWILPFSYMIYPERAVLFAIVPMAVLFAAGIDFVLLKIKPFSKKHRIVAITGSFFMVLFLSVIPSTYNMKKFISCIEANSTVTQDDMNAFAWLAKNTKDKDVTKTNYGDAGIWIPSIIQRRVTTAHLNIMHLCSYEPFPEKPKFIFVGSKCVYEGSCTETKKHYLDDPDYEIAFQSNDTYIFKLKDKRM